MLTIDSAFKDGAIAVIDAPFFVEACRRVYAPQEQEFLKTAGALSSAYASKLHEKMKSCISKRDFKASVDLCNEVEVSIHSDKQLWRGLI